MEGATYFLVLDWVSPVFWSPFLTGYGARLSWADSCSTTPSSFVCSGMSSGRSYGDSWLRPPTSTGRFTGSSSNHAVFLIASVPTGTCSCGSRFRSIHVTFNYRSSDCGLYCKANAPVYQSRTSSGPVDLSETPRTTVQGGSFIRFGQLSTEPRPLGHRRNAH